MRLVVDCSVTMAWCFEDESSTYTDRVLDRIADGEGLVPCLWLYEVLNVVTVAERCRRLREAEGARFLELLAGLRLSLAPLPSIDERSSILDLARRHHLSAYDAAYLDLAIREGLPLASCDRALRAVCHAAGVPDVS